MLINPWFFNFLSSECWPFLHFSVLGQLLLQLRQLLHALLSQALLLALQEHLMQLLLRFPSNQNIENSNPSSSIPPKLPPSPSPFPYFPYFPNPIPTCFICSCSLCCRSICICSARCLSAASSASRSVVPSAWRLVPSLRSEDSTCRGGNYGELRENDGFL